MILSLFKACFVVAGAIFLRWTVSVNPYSGAGHAPMFGDYEAQRHWMEITVNLPAKDWYVNGTYNDLQYWGLDYPPLTAYHSWICGQVAKYVNSSWIELFTSRGVESPTHKLFMRYTVLVTDILIYIPAVFVYMFLCTKLTEHSKWWNCILMLTYPGLILIDHGHFQYNTISLGLTLWAIIGLCRGHDILGSVAFVLALNYKQMSLYHAVPFFCYLLGSAFTGKQNWFLKLFGLAATVIITFAVCWLPFLDDTQVALQVLRRLFPFARGVYEDKVANFWCTIAPILKTKLIFTTEDMVKICLGTTLAVLLPSSLHLLFRPSIRHFKFTLVNSSLVFFLFSYQVHEKSILLPALPVCLLIPHHAFSSLWFVLISSFSMLPLLVKDGLFVPYIATAVLFFMLVEIYRASTEKSEVPTWNKLLFWLSMLGALVLTIAHQALDPPPKLPDFFPVLISAYSCIHFMGFLIFYHWLQFTAHGKGHEYHYDPDHFTLDQHKLDELHHKHPQAKPKHVRNRRHKTQN